jgi:undecaprenyl diphosphate synthase
MMWHTADSQFYFTEKLWPDFGKLELNVALDDYANRSRRFGK